MAVRCVIQQKPYPGATHQEQCAHRARFYVRHPITTLPLRWVCGDHLAVAVEPLAAGQGALVFVGDAEAPNFGGWQEWPTEEVAEQHA